MKQRHAQTAFEFAQLFRDGGLRNEELFCGARDAGIFGDGVENRELMNVHTLQTLQVLAVRFEVIT